MAARGKLEGEGVAAEALAERLGADVGVTGDRLARLVDALQAVGDRGERVRLVRVFAAEHEPKGAKKIGEDKNHHFGEPYPILSFIYELNKEQWQNRRF